MRDLIKIDTNEFSEMMDCGYKEYNGKILIKDLVNNIPYILEFNMEKEKNPNYLAFCIVNEILGITDNDLLGLKAHTKLNMLYQSMTVPGHIMVISGEKYKQGQDINEYSRNLYWNTII